MLKRGDATALRREARGARMAGPPLAPAVLASTPGALTSRLITGRPRRLRRLDAHRARALGRVLARVHHRRATATGGLPGWPSRVTGLAAYARGRGRDALARATTTRERALVQRATGAAAAAAGAAPSVAQPFALLHGDLVEDNVVWPAAGGDPVLVDWEFWRMGDPAEDLAYLLALGDLPPAVARPVLQGYGADTALARRVEGWRALVLVDAALWHRAHGHPHAAGPLMDRAAAALD